jgi:hypothetical protein
MSNGRWAPIHYIYIITLHMKRVEKDLRVDYQLDSWWWPLAKILKVWCWHDQSNQSFGRYNIILSVTNDLEPFWMGTSNVSLWQHSKGLNYRALPVDFAVTQCPHEWQNTEPITAQLENITNQIHSVFSAGCPTTTTESTELDLKHLHFGAALLKKTK